MWLLLGGDSEIGGATYRSLVAQGHAVAATTRRRENASDERPFLDLAAPLDDWEPPGRTSGACVFAAVARLAACHADPVGSGHINVTQTLAVIERMLARDIHVIFLSTNQVFDGRSRHVPPDAPVSPVSEYGRQKARVETALRGHLARGAPIAILRLAKVVSSDIPLIRGWVEALLAGKPVRAFHDMAMAPAPTELVSAAIRALLADRAKGIYQLTGPFDISYVRVARFIASQLDAAPSLVSESSALDAGLPEGATPRHTTLDSTLMRDRYGFVVPDAWKIIENVIGTAHAHPHRTPQA